MHISVIGYNMPGRDFCRADGSPMTNVHVGVQLRQEPTGLTRADATEGRWDLEIDTVERSGLLDFRGAAVQGKRGDRFIYITWGEVSSDDKFEMFRRAKLMLDRIDTNVMAAALRNTGLVARVDLTGDDGGPRCARVDPPAVTWSTAAADG